MKTLIEYHTQQAIERFQYCFQGKWLLQS